MEEILKKLLESDVLSEDTKTELQEAWEEAVKLKKAEITEQVTLDVRAELAEQWVKERDVVITKLDSFVSEQIETEFNELRSDIENFRDLEAEYAGKLVVEKQKIAESMNEELNILIDKIDEFFDVRLAEELDELKDDLEFARQNDFGRKIFEAFSAEFSNYVDEDAIQSKLAVTEAKLIDAQAALLEAEKETGKLLREQKLGALLKPLSGAKREQMEFVLQNIETKKLDEAYGHFIGRIITEETAATTITEGAKTTEVKTGDTNIPEDELITEQRQAKVNSLETLKRLAGISS
jgi:hypothetical protein